MNNAYLAKLASDELVETLFFGGFNYTQEKTMQGKDKLYTYKTNAFTLIIKGRIITIDKEKFTRVSDAKRHIQMRYIK
jgi:hypothetical protein